MAETPTMAPGTWRRWEWLIWTTVLAAVVYLQWPMFAGTFYRVTGTRPPATGIAWRSDLPRAQAEARDTGRKILVAFSATWCGPCVAMKHDVWPDRDVGRAIAASYVPVLVDVDRDPVTTDRYRVTGIPTVLVLDADGREVRRDGYLPRSGMLRFLTGQ